jgi:hypothetical protein
VTIAAPSIGRSNGVLDETFIREFSDERAAHRAPQLGAARPMPVKPKSS